MTAKKSVLELYPFALCWMAPHRGKFKVYDRTGNSYIALSASWPTEEGAWNDAWRLIQEREERRRTT